MAYTRQAVGPGTGSQGESHAHIRWQEIRCFNGRCARSNRVGVLGAAPATTGRVSAAAIYRQGSRGILQPEKSTGSQRKKSQGGGTLVCRREKNSRVRDVPRQEGRRQRGTGKPVRSAPAKLRMRPDGPGHSGRAVVLDHSLRIAWYINACARGPR